MLSNVLISIEREIHTTKKGKGREVTIFEVIHTNTTQA